jgi:hypothetical protein
MLRLMLWSTTALMMPVLAQASTPEYVGTWAFDREWCGNPANNSDGREGVAIVINEREMWGHETHCEFRQVRRSQGKWNVSAICWGEGERSRMRFEMTVSGEVLSLRDAGGTATQFRRCPSRQPSNVPTPPTRPVR